MFTFEIEVRTIDEPTNIIENSGIYTADLSVVDTTSHIQKDAQENNDVEFRLKSYFDKISNFEYDPETKQVKFEMPFDWSEKQMSHVSVIHEKHTFQKTLLNFFSKLFGLCKRNRIIQGISDN